MHNLRNFSLKQVSLIWFFSIAISLILLAGGVHYSLAKNNANTQIRVVISSYSKQPDDFVALRKKSDLVIEGIIKEVQPPVWTTPDGLPPLDVAQALNDPNIQLRTPILVSVVRTIKGKASGELLFTVMGGETAQYKIIAEDDRTLSAGNRIIVFLSKAPENAGPWSTISPYYPQFYFIVDGDNLVGTQSVIQRSSFDQQLSTIPENK